METNAMPSSSYSQNGVRSGSGRTSNQGRLWLEFKASLDRTQNTIPYSYFGKLTVSTKSAISDPISTLGYTLNRNECCRLHKSGHTGAKDGSAVSVCCESKTGTGTLEACGTASTVQWVNSSVTE